LNEHDEGKKVFKMTLYNIKVGRASDRAKGKGQKQGSCVVSFALFFGDRLCEEREVESYVGLSV